MGVDALTILGHDQDQDLIAGTQSDGKPRLRVAVPDEVCVVLGRGSRAGQELCLPAVVADQVLVQRRLGGGCAVVLDPGNVIVSLTLAVPGIGNSKGYFQRINHWLCQNLESIGLPGLRQEGSSDLARGDRKVGGSCIYRSRGLLYYSTTLLVAPEIALIERYLRHPPREPPYRRGRRHGDFLGSLGQDSPYRSAPSLAQALLPRLCPDDGSIEGSVLDLAP